MTHDCDSIDELEAFRVNRADGREQYTVHVGWGEDPEVNQRTVPYTFDTRGELAAFLFGIEQGQGWNDYALCERPSWYSARQELWVGRQSRRAVAA